MFNVVGVCEVAAREQGNSHRREIARRDLMSIGARFVSWFIRASIDDERACAARTAERQAGDETRCLDAWNGVRLFKQATKEVRLRLLGRVFRRRQVDSTGRDIFRSEARTDAQ